LRVLRRLYVLSAHVTDPDKTAVAAQKKVGGLVAKQTAQDTKVLPNLSIKEVIAGYPSNKVVLLNRFLDNLKALSHNEDASDLYQKQNALIRESENTIKPILLKSVEQLAPTLNMLGENHKHGTAFHYVKQYLGDYNGFHFFWFKDAEGNTRLHAYNQKDPNAPEDESDKLKEDIKKIPNNKDTSSSEIKTVKYREGYMFAVPLKHQVAGLGTGKDALDGWHAHKGGVVGFALQLTLGVGRASVEERVLSSDPFKS
jgi:hypothetical protein